MFKFTSDNAGTFDRLIPLLPKDVSVLALDFPGHGFSSRYQDGIAYHMIDFIQIIDLVMKEFKWDKVSLLGHSLGSIVSFTFAAIFPERVHMVIGIDALKPGLVNDNEMTDLLKDRVKNTLIANYRNQLSSEPPSYTYEELLEKMFQGTYGSVARDSAHHLLRRNTKPSQTHPGKYYFSRDSRIKWGFKIEQPHHVSLELAKSINMPYLSIKAEKFPYYGGRKSHYDVVKVLEQNPNFYYHLVDSTHHVHLTEPEKVASIISEFLNKYRSKSKL